MGSSYLSPYEDPAAHARLSALIRHHSSNVEDVRAALLRTVEVKGAEEILDLGCGFGFFAEALGTRVARSARFTGIDACPADEDSYVRSVETSGRRARFMCMELDSRLPFEDDSFDLVIATYSLYFFVSIIGEAARVLRPGGHFLAVTHSERCLAGLLGAVGLSGGDYPLVRLIRGFSSENGEALLAPSFSRVGRVEYHNTLSFGEGDLGDLLQYLRFKLPLLSSGAASTERLPAALERRASEALRSSGGVIIQKDDTLFICGEADDA